MKTALAPREPALEQLANPFARTLLAAHALPPLPAAILLLSGDIL
jgi:hypothetical protein